jgi:serine/threonine-protein kinase
LVWSNPEPGTVLAGRYKLVSALARGGMGSVWKAEHLALSCEVAVKLIDPRVAALEMGVPRFLREARALASLHSPHIVRVSDVGTEGDIVYLVMELLEGRTLGQRLQAEGKLSAVDTLRVVSEVCKAMSHAHERGIVHRDLKPDNIFLCDQSREHLTKVLDFGIAKPLGLGRGATDSTDVGSLLGTPSYMSPEQCRGLKEIDQRSDLWAIGAISYECLLGQRLFEGDVIGDLVVRICTEELPLASRSGGVPAGFDVWLRKAMARNPADRFQSALELCRALARALELEGEPSAGLALADTQLAGPVISRSLGSASGGSASKRDGALNTLDRGTSARSAREPARGLGAGLKLLIAGLLVSALIATVATLQRRGSPASSARTDGVVPAPESPSAPARVEPSGVAAGDSHRASAALAVPAEVADAGARSVPAAPAQAPRAGAAPSPPPKPSVTRPRSPNEVEALRRQR